MSAFQTLTSIVILIFVLSVVVQAIQEVIKALLSTKAKVMEQTIVKFMGEHLTCEQVKDALALRGLDITALENFNTEDFRHLLDGIQFQDTQLQGIIASASATLDQIKDNIAASYEGARETFQRAYTRKNKLFVIFFSFVVVIILNANLFILYEQISADQAAQQSIIGKAGILKSDQLNGPESSAADLGVAYSHSRDQISKALQNYPILIRTTRYKEDSKDHTPIELPGGLLTTVILVSLGAPFWNDILKGMMGINNTLNTNTKNSS
jgi:hypothetical protein